MTDPITFESIGVSMSTHPEAPRVRPQVDTPCKILILGDFSGRANRGEETDGSDIDRRKLYRVDRDNDDAVIEKMGLSLRLQWGGGQKPPVELVFEEMDDFHPEQIFYRTPIFKALKKSRRQLLDPESAAEILSRLSKKTSPSEEAGATGPILSPDAAKIDFSGETTAGLLDQVLDASSPESISSGNSKPQTDWDRFLGSIVGPHLVPDIGDEQGAMVAAVDRSISETMRGILHHPDFQAIESAWRALRFCLRKMETDEMSMVYLLDCTQSEVASDLTAHEEIRDTALYKKLSSAALQHGGDSPWSLLAGLYTFTPKKSDGVTLARLGALGEVLGAPFIGEGDTRLVGCPSLSKTPDPSDWTLDADPSDTSAWRMIRTLPEARWIGLAMPRFMIRLPYGEKTDPVDAFDFEEVQAPVDHEDYLWAHPVFSIVLIFGRTYTAHGWQWSQGLINEVSDLPMHLLEDDGQRTIKPCAEVLLSERALETIISNGLMPLISIRNQGCIRLARFQSIADPLQVLAGCWSLP